MINSVEYRLAKQFTLNQLIWRRNKANKQYVNFTVASSRQRTWDMAMGKNLEYWNNTYFKQCQSLQNEIDMWNRAIEIKRGEKQ